jgi:hypothetical protein
MHRIEFKQVRRRLHRPVRFVDMHELQFRVVPRRAQRQSADTTETIDANLDSHFSFLRRVNGARLDPSEPKIWAPQAIPALRNIFILIE